MSALSIFRTATVALVIVGLSTVAACTNQPAASGSITVTGAWARNSPAVATAGAVYMSISNGGSAQDDLTGASVDPSIAANVEIHETVAAGSGMGTDEPMMEMRPVESVVVPAGQTVALEPGGYHIMLLDLAAPLQIGEQIDLTLVFENAGEIDVTAEIRETQP
jgi:copper(I)-binding protein